MGWEHGSVASVLILGDHYLRLWVEVSDDVQIHRFDGSRIAHGDPCGNQHFGGAKDGRSGETTKGVRCP